MRVILLLSTVALGAAMTQPARADYTIEKLIQDLQSVPNQQLKIIEDVIVVTPDGPLIFNENYAVDREKNYNEMLTLSPICGVTGHPVLLKQASGSFEYRWCKGNAGYAGLDIYQYVGGTAYLTANKQIPCSGSGIPPAVRAQAC